MRKILLGMMAAAALLTVSCAQDDLDVAVNGGTSTVSFTLGIGTIQTRAFSQGENAKNLQYAVYEKSGDALSRVLTPDKITDFTGKRTLDVQLINGHTYVVVFWADAYGNATEAPYTVDFGEAEPVMTVDYSKVTANSDDLDAFFASKEITVNGNISAKVELTRPFAQINIGTGDFAEAKELGYEPVSSSITLPAYTKLCLADGTVDEEAAEKTFAEAAIPAESETFPASVSGYNYLAMAYVLVSGEPETVDVTFAYRDEEGEPLSRKVGSVPVQRNYRTNLYGNILTSTAGLEVETKPGFGGDKEVMLVWDGKTVTTPTPDAEGNYTIFGADELVGLAQMPDEDFDGVTISISNSFDFDGNEFPSFAKGATRGGSSMNKAFRGVIDGNNNTISNFKVSEVSSGNDAAGFIASLAGEEAALKNLTFDYVEIEGGIAEQAGIVGVITEGATVENVVVKHGSVSATEAAGGIVGRVLKNGHVRRCENHADVSTTAHNVGGIVGAAYYTEANSTMTVSDCDNYGNVSGNYGVGGVVGLSCAEISNCNNYGSEVICNKASVGGIVGEQKATGSIKNCTNYANVQGGDGGTSTYGAGGIVGWIRYDASTSNYGKLSTIEVSGCTNEGKHIVGVTGVGGIVGMWYCDGLCTNNTNLAESITASGNFVAGIVGGVQFTEVDSEAGKEYTKKLTVTYNKTYTADENINGGCKADIIYDNTVGVYTVIEHNEKYSKTTVSSFEALTSALAEAEEGAYIKLEKGQYDVFAYSSNTQFETPNVIIDCGGSVFTGNENHLLFNETTTVKNATFRNYTEKHTAQNVNSACGAYGNICGNFENCVFEGESALRYAIISGNTTFKNCQFIAENEHAIHVDACKVEYTVTFDNCTASGYCPLGGNLSSYVIEGCTFSTNEAGFGGVGLRRPTTLTDCKFFIGGQYNHDEIALKAAGISYAFTRCTVNNAALTDGYEFAVGADNVTVTIDGTNYPLAKTGDKPKRP